MSVPSSRRNRQQRRAARGITTTPGAVDSGALDFTTEYGHIRRDLVRILMIGGGLIVTMIVLFIAQVF